MQIQSQSILITIRVQIGLFLSVILWIPIVNDTMMIRTYDHDIISIII